MSKKALYTKDDLIEAAQTFRNREDYKYQYQFLCCKDIYEPNIQRQLRGCKGSATILYKNMMYLGLYEMIAVNERLIFKMGGKKSPLKDYPRSYTHHIIPVKLKKYKKEIEQILIAYDIDVNDGRNGIILPSTCYDGKYNFAKGAIHGRHTDKYEEILYTQIKDCTQENFWQKIDEIKWKLYKNEISIVKNHKPIR